MLTWLSLVDVGPGGRFVAEEMPKVGTRGLVSETELFLHGLSHTNSQFLNKMVHGS